MNLKLFKTETFYNHNLEFFFIAFLLFYLFSAVLIKFFHFFYLLDLILPTLAILKLIVFFFYLVILIANFKRRRKIFIFTSFLLLVFLMGNLNLGKIITLFNNSYHFNDLYKYSLSMNITYLIKYLYPFFFLGVFSLLKNKQKTIKDYFVTLEKTLIFNAFFVFLGFSFSIDFFQSYMHSNRFGYSGILEAGFLEYLLMIVISRKLFLDEINLKLAILTISSLLIGTKIIILFYIVLLFYYLYEKRKVRLLFIYIGVMFLGLFFLKPIINVFAKIFPFWQPILNKYGYLTLITSTRDWNIQNTIEYIRLNGTLKNLFVGGLEFSKCGVEMDFIDLFLFFGIIGTVVYILFLGKLIYKSYHLIPLIAAFFSGDFLLSTITISIYFLWMYESHSEQKALF
ncbi:hypothetical protein [Flavobacterium sp.]|uniref:hypothetical protein n=1 Tax=Flavobacterium sp. TaxID=239 RepID=UPI00374CE25E